MPLLRIATNQTINQRAKEEFLTEASSLVAVTLGKSEDYVMTLFETDKIMTFAGDRAPTAYLEIKSLGLTTEQSRVLSEIFCKLVEDKLSVPQSRVYIEFSNPDRPFWGWNGRTF